MRVPTAIKSNDEPPLEYKKRIAAAEKLLPSSIDWVIKDGKIIHNIKIKRRD